ncbi:MAG: SUMF1/EgtB/PvdO family nonheme iron enzyme [Paracoccaceae bacterium]
MNDTANNVIDARLSEALGTYFNGVTLLKTVGDCAILSGVRKQNGAPVSIYTPSFAVARDEAIAADIGKAFATYDKIASPHLQATERLLTSRAFRKSPALAVLSCPVPVFDEAFDTLPVDARLQLFDQVLDGLAALHGAGLIHGNLSADVVRRETTGGIARLTDLTFSGDRSTTVTAQPAAYQSAQVINTTQPRAEDDVHAAGMLGYRILLGPDGPAIALTGGPADPEAVVAAILGEARDAPDAAILFPDGHEKSEQVARLLARMTGRLPNATPYSNAGAAKRAFQSVLTGVSAPEPITAPSASATSVPTAHMASPSPTGVSKAVAITLFTGFLCSTAAASYFYMANQTSLDQRDSVVARLKSDTARFNSTEAARQELRNADRALTTAVASGTALASTEASAAVESARTTLASADAAIEGTPNDAATQAGQARAQAEMALELGTNAKTMAAGARETALSAEELAALAVGSNISVLVEASDRSQQADLAQSEGRYEVAATLWSEAEAGFSALIESTRNAANETRSRIQSADLDAAGAGAILAKSYISRADAAFDEGRFANADELYQAALATLDAPVKRDAPGVAETREISIGDSPVNLDAAIALCREAAPIDPANCPSTRPAGEQARDVALTPFSVDATEVSVANFQRFVDETGHKTEAETAGRIVALTSSGEARLIDGAYTWSSPDGAGSQAVPERPVTNIALTDARAYCAWAGGRLPREAEWEAAARGDSQAAFPWGTWSAEAPVWRGAPTPARRLPTPVSAAGGATAQGHQGMAGNVREWVMGEDGAVLKGGSWNTANPADLRISARLIVPGNAPGVDFGFRCARDLEAWP